MKEVELRGPLAAHLEPRGYRLFFDPDGTDYFDAIALKGEEVGLVELKVADWKRVFHQALIRRGWGDWVALLLPRRSLAEKVLARAAPAAAQVVGVWCMEEGKVRELRPAVPSSGAPGREAFEPLRRHLRESLAMLESGLLPEGVEWRIVHPVRRGGPRGRALDPKLWRLEELGDPSSERPPS